MVGPFRCRAGRLPAARRDADRGSTSRSRSRGCGGVTALRRRDPGNLDRWVGAPAGQSHGRIPYRRPRPRSGDVAGCSAAYGRARTNRFDAPAGDSAHPAAWLTDVLVVPPPPAAHRLDDHAWVAARRDEDGRSPSSSASTNAPSARGLPQPAYRRRSAGCGSRRCMTRCGCGVRLPPPRSPTSPAASAPRAAPCVTPLGEPASPVEPSPSPAGAARRPDVASSTSPRAGLL